MYEDFPMYYLFISPLKSSYFKYPLKLETKSLYTRLAVWLPHVCMYAHGYGYGQC